MSATHEMLRLADEIEALAEPWTRSHDDMVRQAAAKIRDRARDLQRLVDEMRRGKRTG